VEQTDLAQALTQHDGVVECCPDGALLVTGLDCLAIGAIACAHDTTVFELAAHGPSLEEAFFDLTRHETDYGATQLTRATHGA